MCSPPITVRATEPDPAWNRTPQDNQGQWPVGIAQGSRSRVAGMRPPGSGRRPPIHGWRIPAMCTHNSPVMMTEAARPQRATRGSYGRSWARCGRPEGNGRARPRRSHRSPGGSPQVVHRQYCRAICAGQPRQASVAGVRRGPGNPKPRPGCRRRQLHGRVGSGSLWQRR